MKVVVPAILAAVCILVLLIFVPTQGFPGAEVFEYDKVLVVGLDKQTSGGDDYWSNAIDGGYAGYSPGSESIVDSHLPDGVKYAAGLSEDAKKINSEFYNLATKLANLSANIPNKKAHAFYLLSAAEQENHVYAQGDPTLSQVFLPFLWHVSDYANDNTIIKNAWAGNTCGARAWWAPDPDPTMDAAGPISVYASTLANPQFRTASGMADELGKNADGSIGRTQNGANGHNTNYYDAFIVTSGTVSLIWKQVNNDKRAELLSLCSSNDYFYIGYTALNMNFGNSISSRKNGTMQNCANGESMTPELAITWCKELSKESNINKIRAFVDKEKPASMYRSNNTGQYLWYTILKDSQAVLGNSFFATGYKTNGSIKPYHTGSGEPIQWYGYNRTLYNSNKISTPIKLIMQSVILEKRYSGAY